MPVLTAADLELARERPGDVAARYGVDAPVLKRMLAGELDTVLGACVDHRGGPHAPPGQPCRASFMRCLDCPCARAMPQHLTVQILVLDGLVPAPRRLTAKNYLWQLLNCPEPPALRRFTRTRLAVRSIVSLFSSLTVFLVWLDIRGITALADVGPDDLDAYLADLLESGTSRDTLGERIITVRRLWAWREVLPARDRLPEAPPWRGADADELIGRKRRSRENRTPRIPPATIDRLMLWSLRFVEDFSADILAIRDEYAALAPRSFTSRHRHGGHEDPRTPEAFHADLQSLL